MTRIRCLLAMLLGALIADSASAQFFPVLGLPVIFRDGISFRVKGSHLRIDGFLPVGDPYMAIVPATPTPFGYRQVAPAFLPYTYGYGYVYGLPPVAPGLPFPGYGSINQRVTVQIINPPGLANAGFRRVPDLSGIDLDVEPASKIWGERPDVAKGKAKPADVAKGPRPKWPEVAKADPDDKKPRIAADQGAEPFRFAPRKAEPPPDGTKLEELGVAAFRAGEFGTALLRFRQAGDADAPAPRAWFLQGQALIAVGKYRDAVDAIQKGLAENRKWPSSGFNPKVELFANNLDAWTEQRQQLEQTQARNPKNADYLFLLGYLAWFDGNRDAAIGYFRRARDLGGEPRWTDMFLKI
ncbi:MAG: tetratricopeptide repeat protein [Planctomycetes bacterium]|nr:tetratricopeptide repeat protein [Planctomycetota bacterium]